MSWSAWIWGAIVALLTGSLAGVTVVAQFPGVTGLQLFLVTYPVVAGVFLAWLKQSPFPETNIPPATGGVK